MTSFYATSFEFFSDQPDFICAFLTTNRSIFHSSIIPVTLNLPELWAALESCSFRPKSRQSLLEVFELSHTLQFSPTMHFGDEALDPAFLGKMLTTLINERRYFCRTLKHFQTFNRDILELVCKRVPTIQTLRFSNETLQDSDLQLVASSLPALEALNVSESKRITGTGLAHLSPLRSLKKLDIYLILGLNEGEGLTALPYLPSLEVLDISYIHNIDDECMINAIAQQKNLTSLSFIMSLRRGVITPEAFKVLGSSLSHLVELNLGSCEITDDQLAAFCSQQQGRSSLKRLILWWNTLITDAGVESVVRAFPNLEYLDLESLDHLTNASLQEIAKLTSLQTLKIMECSQFDDEGIEFLKDNALPMLRWFEVGAGVNDDFSDRLINVLLQMKSLRKFVGWVCKDEMSENGIKRLKEGIEDVRLLE